MSLPQWPHHEQDEIDAAVAVLQSGRTNQWTGSTVSDFEQACAMQFSLKHVLAVAAAIGEHIVQIEIVRSRVGNNFDQTDRVVADIADRATRKPGKPRNLNRTMVVNQFSQLNDRVRHILTTLTRLQVGRRNPLSSALKEEEGLDANERVSTDLLSPFDALEEKGVLAVRLDLEVGTKGRLQVRQNLPGDGNELRLICQFSDSFDGWMRHEMI